MAREEADGIGAIVSEMDCKTMPNEKLRFHGSIAPIMSAISTGGMDGGARVKIDIPEMDMEAVAVLMALRQKPLIFTVEVDRVLINKTEQDNGKTPMAAGAKRESKWTAPKKPDAD